MENGEYMLCIMGQVHQKIIVMQKMLAQYCKIDLFQVRRERVLQKLNITLGQMVAIASVLVLTPFVEKAKESS